jgi:hypothetical protein
MVECRGEDREALETPRLLMQAVSMYSWCAKSMIDVRLTTFGANGTDHAAAAAKTAKAAALARADDVLV